MDKQVSRRDDTLLRSLLGVETFATKMAIQLLGLARLPLPHVLTGRKRRQLRRGIGDGKPFLLSPDSGAEPGMRLA